MSRRKSRKKKTTSYKTTPSRVRASIEVLPYIKWFIGVVVAAGVGVYVESFFEGTDKLNLSVPNNGIESKTILQTSNERSAFNQKTWDLLIKKTEQLNNLVKEFDNDINSNDNALKIAKVLHQIFIGEGLSLSLLDQLKIKHLMQYYDSSSDYKPPPLGMWRLSPFIGLAYVDARFINKNPVQKYRARIQEGYTNRLTTFDFWSRKTVIQDEKVGTFSRIDLIIATTFIAGVDCGRFRRVDVA